MKNFLIFLGAILFVVVIGACSRSTEPVIYSADQEPVDLPEVDPIVTMPTMQEPAGADDEYPDKDCRILFTTSFEDGYERFTPRGLALTRVSDNARTGNYSLFVTNRTSDSHAITIDFTGYALPNQPHGVSIWVNPVSEEATFRMAVEFIVRGTPTGRTLWQELPLAPTPAVTFTATAQPGEWTELRAYRPTYDFEAMVVHLETVGSPTVSFYIDDVTLYDMQVRHNWDSSLPRLFEELAGYFLVGTAIGPPCLEGVRFDFMRHHFRAITAGNDMKPDALQPRQGEFFWDIADHMVDTALANDMYVIGHTLVWHAQSPEWMNYEGICRDQAIENLVTHVTEVVSRYRGRVIAWDVVNEAFPSSVSGDPTDWRSALRDTPWLRAIGPEYIEIAFRAAHAADPYAILIYNDYNLNQPGKREAVFHMVQELLEMGVPIHAIGMQGHYSTDTSPAEVEDSIIRFSELEGIEIHITELDITLQGSLGQTQMTITQERIQAIQYAQMFHIFKRHSDRIARVTLWGMCDATSWRANRFPLPFNGDLSTKLGFDAILDPEAVLRQFRILE